MGDLPKQRSCIRKSFWSSSRAASTSSPTFHQSEQATLVGVWWNGSGKTNIKICTALPQRASELSDKNLSLPLLHRHHHHHQQQQQHRWANTCTILHQGLGWSQQQHICGTQLLQGRSRHELLWKAKPPGFKGDSFHVGLCYFVFMSLQHQDVTYASRIFNSPLSWFLGISLSLSLYYHSWNHGNRLIRSSFDALFVQVTNPNLTK